MKHVKTFEGFFSRIKQTYKDTKENLPYTQNVLDDIKSGYVQIKNYRGGAGITQITAIVHAKEIKVTNSMNRVYSLENDTKTYSEPKIIIKKIFDELEQIRQTMVPEK